MRKTYLQTVDRIFAVGRTYKRSSTLKYGPALMGWGLVRG